MENKKDNKSIFEKIDEMYNLKNDDGKQKNKAFFSHLIKAYLPAKSVVIARENPENKKVRVRCVFSKKNLITVEGVRKEMNSSAFKRNFDEFLKSYDVEKSIFTSTTPMKQLLNGKVLAIQGRDTETYMSQESYATFINWVMTKYLNGDNNIKWILDKMSDKPFHPGITVKRKKKAPQMYSTKGTKPSTMGDLSALQELKNKFKDEE